MQMDTVHRSSETAGRIESRSEPAHSAKAGLKTEAAPAHNNTLHLQQWSDTPKIYVLHENDDWMPPLRAAAATLGLQGRFEEWHLHEGSVDLTTEPPHGVFFNRMSPSSNTRGHRFAPEFIGVVLSWLEAHGRTIVNGSAVHQLELSKAAQYASLGAAGIPVPRTVPVVGTAALRAVAAGWPKGTPLMLKPNRGGKGAGVQLFSSPVALLAHLDTPGGVSLVPEADGRHASISVDGVFLVQEYIPNTASFITRVELVDSKPYYTVRVSTADGFELCPADACGLPAAAAAAAGSQPVQFADLACPATAPKLPTAEPKFIIAPELPGLDTPEGVLLGQLSRWCQKQKYLVAGIEFATHDDGRLFVYDINQNTNHNQAAEAASGHNGTLQALLLLRRALLEGYPDPPLPAVSGGVDCSFIPQSRHESERDSAVQ